MQHSFWVSTCCYFSNVVICQKWCLSIIPWESTLVLLALWLAAIGLGMRQSSRLDVWPDWWMLEGLGYGWCLRLFLDWNQSICDIYPSIKAVETANHSGDKQLPGKITAQEFQVLASLGAFNFYDVALGDVLSCSSLMFVGGISELPYRPPAISRCNDNVRVCPCCIIQISVDVSCLHPYSHLHSYTGVHALNRHTKKDYQINSWYPSSRCIGSV